MPSMRCARGGRMSSMFSGRSQLRTAIHAPPEVLEVPEELRARIEHQHVALVLEGGAVGFEAAVKGVELGILVEGARVDRRGPGVAFALDALRVAVGLGD